MCSFSRLFSSCVLLSLVLLSIPSAAFGQMPDQIDSLVNVYESAKGESRVAAGRRLLEISSEQKAFFDDKLELNSSMEPRENDLVVYFAAERYLLTTSYFKEALGYIKAARSAC